MTGEEEAQRAMRQMLRTDWTFMADLKRRDALVLGKGVTDKKISRE